MANKNGGEKKHPQETYFSLVIYVLEKTIKLYRLKAFNIIKFNVDTGFNQFYVTPRTNSPSFVTSHVFKRPSVAGAVLQTPSSFIHSFIN